MDIKPSSLTMQLLNWIKKIIKQLPMEKRLEVIAEITPQASPGFDFFLLVVLSCSIATMGLITDSPAVIIGAMLIAPLMSPLIGIGLASINGDTHLLSNAFTALARGASLAIALAFFITVVNNLLPFFNMQELPKEILSRTHPTPLDLIIALAGGLAAAYAMTKENISAALPGVAIATALMPPLCTVGIGLALNRWDVAGGAILLFTTNAVTIAFASALVFFLSGFSSKIQFTNHHIPSTLILTAGLTLVLLIPLSYYSVKFFREASENRLINTVVAAEVTKLGSASLVDLNTNRGAEGLEMIITIRTNSALHYEQVVSLQKAIVSHIHQPISLKVNQVFSEQLDPLIPPTPTYTPTPGPSPTYTHTPTPSPTSSPTPTPSASATATPLPTHTITPTWTPAPAQVLRTVLPQMKIYQDPGGPPIGDLALGQQVKMLHKEINYDGLTWVEVMDDDGRVGWIPEVYIHLVFPTATQTNTPATPSPQPEATLPPPSPANLPILQSTPP